MLGVLIYFYSVNTMEEEKGSERPQFACHHCGVTKFEPPEGDVCPECGRTFSGADAEGTDAEVAEVANEEARGAE